MKTVYLYCGLSVGYQQMLRYLSYHKFNLRAKNLYYEPSSPDAGYGAESHQRLIQLVNHPKTLGSAPKFRLQWQLQVFEEKLTAGSDLLLAFSGLRASHTLALISLLRSRPGFGDCRFVVLLSVGHQDVWLEQWARLNSRHINNLPLWLEECERTMFDKDCLQLDSMVDSFVSELGRENVHVLRDFTSSCIPCPPNADFLKNFFDILGIDVPGEQHPSIDGHRLTLLSRDARQYYLWCIRPGNTWPNVNLNLWECLQHIEQDLQLDSRPIMSPEILERVRHAATEGSRKVAESFFNLKKLFPQDNVLKLSDSHKESTAHNAWEPYIGLSDVNLNRIADALPEFIVAGLVERAAVDDVFLTPNQKRIVESLHNILFQKKIPTVCVWKKTELAPVAVLTITHKHRDFIADNIESVLAQKTDFPVEHFIVDDYSQDGSRDIISRYAAKYPTIRPYFLAQHSNAGSGIRTLFSLSRNRYVSICDGDDYFCDPDKLQIQYDYLESHPRHGLCFHPVKIVYDGVPGKDDIYPNAKVLPRGLRESYYLSDLFKTNFIQTNSVMYRWRFCNGLPSWFDGGLVPGDWYWHLLHAEKGSIGFIEKTMSVYRRHTNALYINATNSPIQHRLKTGLHELHAYNTVRKHFGKSCEPYIFPLVCGVINTFAHHARDTGDESIVQKTAALFPEFSAMYLNTILK